MPRLGRSGKLSWITGDEGHALDQSLAIGWRAVMDHTAPPGPLAGHRPSAFTLSNRKPTLPSLQELLVARFATRAISSEPIAASIVELLLEAARLAPSCRNKQPWRFLMLQSPDALAIGGRALAAGNLAWASRAPLLVVALTSRERDCVIPDGRDYYRFDLGMAVMNLMLSATEQGLVARPMAGFDPEILQKELSLQPGDEALLMLAIGYPSQDDAHVPDYYRGPQTRTRLPLSDIARFL